jgi:diguanylate cyclase (GGDEF)-like protein/PAS domain S-box-containing protein
MVGLYPLVHLACFLIYAYLAGHTLYKNPRASLNRVTCMLLLCLAVWSFGMIFIHNPHSTKETARLFDNLASVGSYSFASFTLWFALILTRKRRAFEGGYIYPFFFVIPAVLIYKQYTGWIATDYVLHGYGWSHVWGRSYWTWLFYVYYIGATIAALVLIHRHRVAEKDPFKKRQAGIVFACILLALILGTLTDVVLPETGLIEMPDIGNVLALIWAVGVVYAIARYRFLSITPGMAAATILATRTDALILLDTGKKIVTVNQAALDLLGYEQGELEGKPAGIIFASENFERAQSEDVLRGRQVPAMEFLLKAKSGRNIPVSLSSSRLLDESGKKTGSVCIARDITERKKAEDDLRRSEERFRQVADITHEWIWEVDTEGLLTYSSPALRSVLGYGPEEVVGRRHLYDFFHEETKEKLKKVIAGQFARKLPIRDYHTAASHKEGRTVNLETCASPVLSSGGHLLGYRGVSVDVTQGKKMEADLQDLALTDDLTGLVNRRGFFNLAEQQIKLALRTQRGLLLVLVDIYHLRGINDHLSHNHGDQALTDVAELLRGTFRRSDIVARIGGDEFAAMEIDARKDSAAILVSRVEESVRAFNETEKKPYALALSYGTAWFDPAHRVSIDELLAAADTSLRAYKKTRDR